MNARLIRCAMTTLVLATAFGTSVSGCLERPVVPGEPTTKTNFTTNLSQETIDKIDILFSIDNSASMGDKQAYLEAAIPDLIDRLVNPFCVDGTGKPAGHSTLDADGTANCSAYPDTQPEFPAVHDMHIGVVSSSLGDRLGDQCPTAAQDGASGTITVNGASLDRHNDDKAHLITRSSDPSLPATATPTEAALPDAQSSGFLAWFPTSNTGSPGTDVTPVTKSDQLETDFKDLIAGVHEYGCGIESQLENWYRFLVQPDPYADMAVVDSKAQWVGVDTTIIKQRHDFLRPDSLVAIIVLTDENDSEVDVRSDGGQGYYLMGSPSLHGFYPEHGTPVCATNPADPGCITLGKNDPSPYSAIDDWGFDTNLRHVHMKAKYGVDFQFPINRYVTGLSSAMVPDRSGEYPPGAGNYVGTKNCANPLFASTLPDGSTLSANVSTQISSADAATLCNAGAVSTTRKANEIFYAIIGGVPWQLLHYDPNSVQNSTLTTPDDAPGGQDDWTRILGANPDKYDYTGIDPHMVESYQPRTATPGYSLVGALSGAGGESAAETNPAPASGPNSDPYNGREWITNGTTMVGGEPAGIHFDLRVDREYACIFELVDSTGAPAPRDCSRTSTGAYTVPANQSACDCSSVGLMQDQLSPLCDPAKPTSQVYAKAYPTIRELSLANELGAQGIVSSICPIHVVDATTNGTDPLYGYRPAVSSIINRLKVALTKQCLPEKLTPPEGGAELPCVVLATLASATNPDDPEADCTSGANVGLTKPSDEVLAQFEANPPPGLPANVASLPTCQVNELTGSSLDPTSGSCTASMERGWCYVTGAAAGNCSQAILFSPRTIPNKAVVNFQCIETSSAHAAGALDGG